MWTLETYVPRDTVARYVCEARRKTEMFGGQANISDLEYESKKRKTRREIFLERMDSLIPSNYGPGSSMPKA